jgi:hypothetical protein
MKQLFSAHRLSFLFCLFSVSSQVAGLYAQNNQPDSVALKRELTLEREYNPVLKDAAKISRLPEIKEPEAPRTSIEYSNFTIPYIVSPYLRTIQPNAYFASLETSKHRGYLNLSAGVPLNIDGDWGYQLLNTNRDYLSIYASHRSTNQKVTYLRDAGNETMKINDNNVGISYSHHFGAAKFTADMQYLNAAFNYYGQQIIAGTVNYNPDKTQMNHLFQVRTGIESEENDEINYRINLAYNLFKQKQGCLENIKGPLENRYAVDFDLKAPFNSTVAVGLQGFLKSYFYQLPEYTYFNNIQPDEKDGKYNYTTVSFNPYFTFTGDNWNVRLGANVGFQFGATKNFLLSPNIHLNWLPVEKIQFYLQALGGIEENGYYNTFFENRYVNPHFRICDSRSPFDATLGINFLLLSNISLNVFTGYRQAKDEHFYVTDYYLSDANTANYALMQQSIAPVYMKAETFKWGASVKYAYQDIFDFHLRGVFYNWSCSNLNRDAIIGSSYIQEIYPWNRPSFAGNIESGFRLPGLPLKFNLNYQLSLGRKNYVVSREKGENMKDIHDLSVKVAYPVNSMISVYAVANNLLFQKYELWQGYPAQGFNIMGGISIKF